jgi:hypothetical protein
VLRLDWWSGSSRGALAREAATLFAMTVAFLLWGAAESGMFTSRASVPAPATAASQTPAMSAIGQITVEGSVVLTESPVGNELSQPLKRTKAKKSASEAISTNRSGLTKSSDGPTIISLTTSEDEFGGNADSIFPALPPAKTSRVKTAPSGTYRTLCVRLCDGYYWPISFSTTRDGLGEDKETCEASCGVPVKLFYYRNPNGQPEDSVDLKGEPYMQLANAFRYRNEFVSQCKCQPDPWEAASLDRHKQYAALAQAGKLALYDNRKPKKKRRKGTSVNVVAVIDGVPEAGFGGEDAGASPMTTVSSVKKSKRKATLAIRKKNSSQVSFGAAMGITKVGQSASGKKYSAKKLGGIAQNRK